MQELSLHILDLVQNGIEAGACRIVLTVTEDSAADMLTIRVEDDGRGMDAAVVRKVTDPFYTTRSTRRVGLGLPLIDMSASQCGGQLKIASTVGKGTAVEACWRLSHIDRPPLGDMAQTVKTLFVLNPDIDIQYTHQVDQRSFSATVYELTEILDGIPFTQPDVLEWLGEYLNGHEQQLYGGALNENG